MVEMLNSPGFTWSRVVFFHTYFLLVEHPSETDKPITSLGPKQFPRNSHEDETPLVVPFGW
jgi:hypothetical protein